MGISGLQPRPLTTSPGGEEGPSFSPDGRQVVFAGSDPLEQDFDLFIKDTETGVIRQLTSGPSRDRSPAWSPDGGSIAFHRTSGEGIGVYLISVNGGQPRRITTTGPLPFPDSRRVLGWHPDSQSLVFVDREQPKDSLAVFRTTLDGRRRRLTTPQQLSIGDTNPAVSPDGALLAFARVSAGGISDIMVAAEVGEPRRLASNLGRAGGLTWAADGRSLVFSCSKAGGWVLHRIGLSGGHPERLSAFSVSAPEPAIARNGRRLAYREFSQIRAIHRYRLHEGAAQPETVHSSTRWISGPQYSPDRSRIAYSSLESGAHEIWVCGADGRDARQLTRFGGPVTGSPRWSPDGAHIAFDSAAGGNVDVFVVPAGGGRIQRATDHVRDDAVPSWSQDGRWIYFASNRSGSWQVWKMRFEPEAGTAQAVRVTSEGGFRPMESSDGSWLYFARGRDEPGLMRMAGGRAEVVTERLPVGAWGWWSITEQGVYYIEPSKPGELAPGYVRVLDVDSGRSRTVAALPHLPGRGTPAFSAARDGREFLVAVLESSTSDLVLVDHPGSVPGK